MKKVNLLGTRHADGGYWVKLSSHYHSSAGRWFGIGLFLYGFSYEEIQAYRRTKKDY